MERQRAFAGLVVSALALALVVVEADVLAGEGRPLVLENAGFENTNSVKGFAVPYWRFHYGDPQKDLELVDDAAEGSKAVRIDKGFLFPEGIPIEESDIGKPVTLYCQAKGVGRLHVFFGSSDGQRSTHGPWNTRQTFFALTDEYLPYSYTWKEIPGGSTSVSVSFGEHERASKYLDDVRIVIGQPADPPAETTEEARIPEGIELVNVAPHAKIKTLPYGTLVDRMVDGIPGTGLTLEKHPLITSRTYEFLYDTPQQIAKIRFTLPSVSFVIWADTTGDGEYDRRLALEPRYKKVGYWGMKEWTYYEKTFWPPVSAHAVKIVNYGGIQALFEVQILVPESRLAGQTVRRPPLPTTGVPVVELGDLVHVPPPEPGKRYLQGFHVEPWMFDCPGWLRQDPRPPLDDWPPFQKMLNEMKRMHANLVWLFPPRTWVRVEGREGLYPYDVMWPSKFAKYSHPENLLREFCDVMHREGFTVFAQFRATHWKPLPKPDDVKERPVLSWSYRNTFKGLVEEMTAAGLDGVPLCLDEQWFGGIRNPASGAKQQWTKEAFGKRWNVEGFPETLEDTELARRWCLFHYEQVGRAMREIAQAASKLDPDVRTVTNIGPEGYFNSRLERGIAYDVFGFAAGIDYLGTDPYHTREDGDLGYYRASAVTKRLQAGTPKRGSVVTLNFPWAWADIDKHPMVYDDATPPVSTYGQVIGSAMQGGTAFAYWRYNLAFVTKYDKYPELAFSILDTLAAWGSTQARIPRDIAVLKSRASEDWWQLRVRYGEHGQRADETRGHTYAKWMEEFLLRHDYPFELYFQDQPDSYQDLAEFQLVILPFPYSMSRKAFQQVEKALEAGTKILVFDRKGETDEIGVPYEKPLLEDWIEQGKVTFISDDVPVCGHFPEFVSQMKKTVDRLLGTRKTLSVETYGCDVQVGCLEKSAKEKFIILLNWDDRDAVVDLGVCVPPATGGYRVLQRDMEETRTLSIEGQKTWTSRDLRKFRLPVRKWEVKALYVAPAGNRNG